MENKTKQKCDKVLGKKKKKWTMLSIFVAHLKNC